MRHTFHATVSALAYTIIRERCGDTANPDSFPHNRVAQRVLAQHRSMPDYLRAPIAVLTVLLDLWAVVLTGRPFHRLEHERRWRLVRAWQARPPSFRRDLMRFFESLTVFGWFAERHERALS